MIAAVGAYFFAVFALLFLLCNWSVPLEAQRKRRRGETGGISGFTLVPQVLIAVAALFDMSANWTLLSKYFYLLILFGDVLLGALVAALLQFAYRRFFHPK